MTTNRVMSSEYMYWARTSSQARFNLAGSGVIGYPLAELPVRIEDLEINGPSTYGYAPLQQLLAAKCGVGTENVVATSGASMGNFLAMAATIEPGDEVLIEQPTYDLLVSAARYLGAEVKRFPRRWEDDFRVDPRAIESLLTPRTRLIVLTNLHNPSSALIEENTLKQLGEAARSVKARLLVGEIYLDAMFEQTPQSSFHLGPEFITTNSLTKIYGLSGLRCGWILAEPELARRIWRLNDLMTPGAAHAAERLSIVALENLDRIRQRARLLLDTNRALLNRFLDNRQDLIAPGLKYGTISFPRWQRGNVAQLCDRLRDKYETTVVPGKFFEMPEHFRLGLGCEIETFAAGIERLGYALDSFGALAKQQDNVCL
jgi:aspartate/methionine/tyrosine aminotransferase